MADTVTASGEGFVVWGAVVRETLFATSARTLAVFRAAGEESNEAAEPGEALDGGAPSGDS